MADTQVQSTLIAEIEQLSDQQRLSLLELLRSLRSAKPGPKKLPPLKLHYSGASADSQSTWRREEIYGDDGR